MGPAPAPQDPQAFIADLDEVDLARFRVVGAYTRYDEAVRNVLQDARQKILAGFEPPGRKRENHLIWAAPGTGKTYFVQQVAASLAGRVRYHEVNLAKCTEPEFRASLGRLDDGQACLCLIDECDAKPQEPWPYEVLLPYLDAAVERGARFVFVLAGSSGMSLDEIKQRIAARPKGKDLLSRIPTGHEHVIGPMSLGDRLLIVLSQMRQAGAEAGRDIRAIEKLGLYYVALNPRLANARQLREFAVRAVERVPRTDDRIKYDHLFVPGDPENKTFWAQAQPVAERLASAFVVLAGDRVMVAPSVVVSKSLPDRAIVAPAAATETHPRTNLPRQLTSFIGREQEIEEVKRLLPNTALLTLHGPGGCGKTRLAYRVAADLTDQYADGVWATELAALSDPGLVPKAVATAFDLPEQPGSSLGETLKNSLRNRSALLVLDNCEHLVGACAELADNLLKACPRLRIMATSREPLGIPGEIIWDVPSLSVPEASRVTEPAQLGRFDGIRLFVDRAASNRPGFALTAANAAAVAQVCERLEGIPLAIELAAARVRALTVDQIATRLDDRFRLLTSGGRVGLLRHQTLRATMDWSYGLLSEHEQGLLRRLSVFAGGWTLEAAEGVCAGDGIAAASILDLLTSLADKSILTVETRGGAARYRLLETVRQYGQEKLREGEGTSKIGGAHRDWYLAFVEQTVAEQYGPRAELSMDRLEADHNNIRAALEWSRNAQDGAEAALRFVGALHWFYFRHDHWSEALGWTEGALARSAEAPPAVVPKALALATHLAWRREDYELANVLGEKGLALCRQLDDKHNSELLLFYLGITAHFQGHYDRGARLYADCLNVCAEYGDKWQYAMTLVHEGLMEHRRNRDEYAVLHYAHGLAVFREVGDKWGMAFSLYQFGAATLAQNQHDRAATFFAESLAFCRDVGNRWVSRLNLEGLAFAAVIRGCHAVAARLFGAAEAQREIIGGHRFSVPRTFFHDDGVAMARGALGDADFRKEWAEGRAMTLEQAIECALEGEDQ
ncbi:MAG TPA: AAA family ATPase [bacterium]|nr:AAA family ATPase [bacterium]